MTELKTFLVALYDSLSEAEIEAFVHGQARMAELARSDSLPGDFSVPIYHATDMNIALDVGLDVEATESGHRVFITDPPADEESCVTFNVEVYDLIEAEDVAEIDPEDVFDELPADFPRTSNNRSDSGSNPVEGPSTDDPTEPTPGEGGPTGATADRQAVATVDAIDTSTAEILEHSGISTIADLLTRTPAEIAETVGSAAGEAISVDEAATWREEAEAVAASAGIEAAERPVEDVEGIGQAYGERLREADIETIGELVVQPPEVIAEIVSTENLTVSRRRAAHWIEEADARLADAASTVQNDDSEQPE